MPLFASIVQRQIEDMVRKIHEQVKNDLLSTDTISVVADGIRYLAPDIWNNIPAGIEKYLLGVGIFFLIVCLYLCIFWY